MNGTRPTLAIVLPIARTLPLASASPTPEETAGLRLETTIVEGTRSGDIVESPVGIISYPEDQLPEVTPAQVETDSRVVPFRPDQVLDVLRQQARQEIVELPPIALCASTLTDVAMHHPLRTYRMIEMGLGYNSGFLRVNEEAEDSEIWRDPTLRNLAAAVESGRITESDFSNRAYEQVTTLSTWLSSDPLVTEENAIMRALMSADLAQRERALRFVELGILSKPPVLTIQPASKDRLLRTLRMFFSNTHRLYLPPEQENLRAMALSLLQSLAPDQAEEILAALRTSTQDQLFEIKFLAKQNKAKALVVLIKQIRTHFFAKNPAQWFANDDSSIAPSLELFAELDPEKAVSFFIDLFDQTGITLGNPLLDLPGEAKPDENNFFAQAEANGLGAGAQRLARMVYRSSPPQLSSLRWQEEGYLYLKSKGLV